MDKQTHLILKFIGEADAPIGSVEIAEKLKAFGINLSERSVRYRLQQIEEKGLTKVLWKEGRLITKKGEAELGDAQVFDKVGLMSAKIEAMAYLMDFDLAKMSGQLILNVSLFHKSEFTKALKVMRQVFAASLGMGEKVLVAESGEKVGSLTVPKGKVAFGTLCTINLNGIFLKSSIPIESKFGGVLQIHNGQPLRFTELISYSGSTLDPHEIFIKSRMTSVREAVSGSGKILAGLREIPVVSKNKAEELIARVKQAGIGNVLFVGHAGAPVLGMPVGVERVGIVVPGGLNPIAAAEEWGIETESKALSCLVDYSQLQSFRQL